MAALRQEGPILRIETDCYHAAVRAEGYTSGVMAGSFVDKRTGARDVGFGLVILDFLLEPGTEDPATPPELRYHVGDLYHGNIRKRYVELPQICTQAKKLPFQIVEGKGFVAVKQWFTWSVARPPYRPGSLWEQWLVFPDGARWFLAYDKVTSANDVDCLVVRMDMPGPITHQLGRVTPTLAARRNVTDALVRGQRRPCAPCGDTFSEVYLSYQERFCATLAQKRRCIPSEAFFEDFPPDARNLYQRNNASIPQRFIRGCQLRSGPWLAGMSLDPSCVYEAWCHQRGYICMIQEIGGFPVKAGESFGAVHLVGYFDDIAEMERAFDSHRGAKSIRVKQNQWSLT